MTCQERGKKVNNTNTNKTSRGQIKENAGRELRHLNTRLSQTQAPSNNPDAHGEKIKRADPMLNHRCDAFLFFSYCPLFFSRPRWTAD